MTWFKLDNDFADHPKFVARTDTAIATWVRALAYASRYLTDGVIPKAAQRLIGPDEAIDELLTAAIIIDQGDSWLIHDYTDHQRTKAEVEADRAATAKRVRDYRERRRNGVTNASRNGVSNALVTPLDTDTDTDTDHHQAHTTPQPVDNHAGMKIDEAIEIIVDRRTAKANPKNPSAYKARVRKNLYDELGTQAADLLTRYDPPADVLAAALEGNKANLHHYRRQAS